MGNLNVFEKSIKAFITIKMNLFITKIGFHFFDTLTTGFKPTVLVFIKYYCFPVKKWSVEKPVNCIL
jgi:hypothetical protein